MVAQNDDYDNYPTSKSLSQLDSGLKYSKSLKIDQRLKNIENIERDLEEEIRNIHNELITGDENTNPYKFEGVTFTSDNINTNVTFPNSNESCPEYQRAVRTRMDEINRKYIALDASASDYKDKLNSWKNEYGKIKKKKFEELMT